MNNKMFFFIVVVAGLYGCLDAEIEIDHDFIRSKLKNDLEEYKKLKWYDCHNTIILDAEAYVDTFLMVENVNASLEDGLIFPRRPIKPPYIGFIRLDDTTQKKPILDLLALKRKIIILKRDSILNHPQ